MAKLILILFTILVAVLSITIDTIDIEYCGTCDGYPKAANRLKEHLLNMMKGVKVKVHASTSSPQPEAIQVSWVKKGKLETVWSDKIVPTNKGHTKI